MDSYTFLFSLQARLISIADQWEFLTQKTTEKSLKLKEANKQRTYIAAVKDLDFWLGEVESLLTSEDSGKDLASVQNLIKKHHLVEADIQAHDDRIKGKHIVLFGYVMLCVLCNILIVWDVPRYECTSRFPY